ncbi:MAG TPA: hypothetical protein VFA74_07220 [Terriglobales bacterium]|nr:hypothetical protein [Terriglobales bacterium]
MKALRKFSYKNLPLRNLALAVIFSLAAATLAAASATDVYVTPDGSPQGVCTTNPHNPVWFNTASNWGSGVSQIGPGTTVHLCGTFTAGAGATEFAFQASGTNGNPIKLLFESGAIVQAPYFAASGNGMGCGGGVSICNRSYVIIDGGSNGILRNTANGEAYASQQDSTGVDAYSCQNCTVSNLSILNIFVKSNFNDTSVDQAQMRAIAMTGSHWVVSGNTIKNCGWCLFDAYNNGDTDIEIYGNDMSGFAHALMFATSAAHAAVNPALLFHDNRLHDTNVWDTAGCGYHIDGVHFFGTAGSSMDGVYMYNNQFAGNWGACPTGFVFDEGGGSSTPAHMKNFGYWNNVHILSGSLGTTTEVNTNGWVDIASGDSGTQQIYNNTFIGPNNTDNTLCLGLENLSGVSYENNTFTNCGDPVNISNTKVVAADYNLYGTQCGNGNNCFIWNGVFTGSFAAWKASCNCDSHALQNNNPLLNSDGSPQSSSPVIQQGANLMNIGTGNLGSLAKDTSDGDVRAPLSRPGGSCSNRGTATCWDVGAYQYGTANSPNAPSGLQASVQ